MYEATHSHHAEFISDNWNLFGQQLMSLTVNIQEPVFTSTVTLSALSVYTPDMRLLSSSEVVKTA